jgi:hypothetical protein
MSSARRRSRIAHFKTPFVVSVAAPAALGVACGGVVAHDDTPCEAGYSCTLLPAVNPPAPSVTTSNNPPVLPVATASVNPPYTTTNPPAPAQCPEIMPSPGTSCSGFATGAQCDYDYCYSTQPMVRCGSDGNWHELPLPSCNPPFVSACPEAMPQAGADCSDESGLVCGYAGCEGPSSSTATCTFGQWLVHYSSGPVCNPPAVVPVCPQAQPAVDAGCAYPGQSCSYAACVELTCSAGVWSQLEVACDADAGAP